MLVAALLTCVAVASLQVPGSGSGSDGDEGGDSVDPPSQDGPDAGAGQEAGQQSTWGFTSQTGSPMFWVGGGALALLLIILAVVLTRLVAGRRRGVSDKVEVIHTAHVGRHKGDEWSDHDADSDCPDDSSPPAQQWATKRIVEAPPAAAGHKKRTSPRRAIDDTRADAKCSEHVRFINVRGARRSTPGATPDRGHSKRRGLRGRDRSDRRSGAATGRSRANRRGGKGASPAVSRTVAAVMAGVHGQHSHVAVVEDGPVSPESLASTRRRSAPATSVDLRYCSSGQSLGSSMADSHARGIDGHYDCSGGRWKTEHALRQSRRDSWKEVSSQATLDSVGDLGSITSPSDAGGEPRQGKGMPDTPLSSFASGVLDDDFSDGPLRQLRRGLAKSFRQAKQSQLRRGEATSFATTTAPSEPSTAVEAPAEQWDFDKEGATLVSPTAAKAMRQARDSGASLLAQLPPGRATSSGSDAPISWISPLSLHSGVSPPGTALSTVPRQGSVVPSPNNSTHRLALLHANQQAANPAAGRSPGAEAVADAELPRDHGGDDEDGASVTSQVLTPAPSSVRRRRRARRWSYSSSSTDVHGDTPSRLSDRPPRPTPSPRQPSSEIATSPSY